MSATTELGRRVIRRARHTAWQTDTWLRYGRSRVATTADRRYRAALATAAIISIDVFDTALFRCVPDPADVFEIVGLRLQAARAKGIEGADAFRTLRKRAEYEARQRAAAAGMEEVTLREIFAVLAEMTDIDVARAAHEELAVERAVCVANPDILRLYQELMRAGRRVAFVSDTYLPRDVIAELLNAAGYTGGHEVFVSNEERATKERGTLLPIVAQRLGVSVTAIVHVGDNIGADVRAARRAGVKAFWYAGRVPKSSGGVSIGEKVLDQLAGLATLQPASTLDDNVLQGVGYTVAGPIFLGLMQWMIERITGDPPDLVLFCARDGYFLWTVYERCRPFLKLPRSVYFEVSRRALVFPAITQLDQRALDVLCANNAPLVLPEYFSRIGIDIGAFPAHVEAAGLALDTRVYSEDTRRRVRELFVSLEDVVLERARAERELMVQYLRQNGVFSARSLALVDIGWGGTLQQALADVLVTEGTPRALRGYYLSTDERIATLSPNAGPAEAWFANSAQPTWMQRAISPGYWLLEVAFAAQHGTILGYRANDAHIAEPIRHAYDASTPNAQASRAIHAASLAMVERWLDIFAGLGPALGQRETFARFERFVNSPTHDEARFFGDLVHIGGLGTTAEYRAIAAPPNLRDIVRHPRALLDAYRESHWQIAFLQRVLGSNAVARLVLGLRDTLRGESGSVKERLMQRLRPAGST